MLTIRAQEQPFWAAAVLPPTQHSNSSWGKVRCYPVMALKPGHFPPVLFVFPQHSPLLAQDVRERIPAFSL